MPRHPVFWICLIAILFIAACSSGDSASDITDGDLDVSPDGDQSGDGDSAVDGDWDPDSWEHDAVDDAESDGDNAEMADFESPEIDNDAEPSIDGDTDNDPDIETETEADAAEHEFDTTEFADEEFADDDPEIDTAEAEEEEALPAKNYMLRGPYVVGVSNFRLTNFLTNRELEVSLWYPAVESARAVAASGLPVEQYVLNTTNRLLYQYWLTTAPANGPTKTSHVAEDTTVNADQSRWPLVAFSHCMNCIRFSTVSIAEHLASWGFAVVAPDHTGGTIFEQGPLDTIFLALRVSDIQFVVSSVLTDGNPLIPAHLRSKFDASRVGIYGHSFGSVTTGHVLMDDPRFLGGVLMGGPLGLMGGSAQAISRPSMYVLMREDNDISMAGNDLLRQNYADANPPVRKMELIDAGHMSVTDICQITGSYADCTGSGFRQLPPHGPYVVPPPQAVIAYAAPAVSAFFDLLLNGETPAAGFLSQYSQEGHVIMDERL